MKPRLRRATSARHGHNTRTTSSRSPAFAADDLELVLSKPILARSPAGGIKGTVDIGKAAATALFGRALPTSTGATNHTQISIYTLAGGPIPCTISMHRDKYCLSSLLSYIKQEGLKSGDLIQLHKSSSGRVLVGHIRSSEDSVSFRGDETESDEADHIESTDSGEEEPIDASAGLPPGFTRVVRSRVAGVAFYDFLSPSGDRYRTLHAARAAATAPLPTAGPSTPIVKAPIARARANTRRVPPPVESNVAAPPIGWPMAWPSLVLDGTETDMEDD